MEALLLKSHSKSEMNQLKCHEKIFSTFWRIFGMILMVIFSTFIFSSLITDADSVETIEELRRAVNDEKVRVWYNYVGSSIGQYLKVKLWESLNDLVNTCSIFKP
jgi:hypothetical protein